MGLFTWFPCEFLGQPHGTPSLISIKSSALGRFYVGRFIGRMAGSSHFGSGLFAHQPMFHEGRRCPLCFPLSRFYQALNSGIPKFTSCEIPKAWSFLAVNQKLITILSWNFIGSTWRGWVLSPSTLSFLLWNNTLPRLTLAHPQYLCRNYKINKERLFRDLPWWSRG